jgi:hypothetical protein
VTDNWKGPLEAPAPNGGGRPQPLVVAFHLPQYHPIPENDAWWGPGFTEWTNVTRARPQFPGHYQPHLPADLGFYDLRLPEARAGQAELAAGAGIGAFAYYHYWFNGRRLLEQPVEEIVRSQHPDFPFMIVWANENWTRRWDGGESHVLMEQRHSAEDDLAHITALRATLLDRRYLSRDGRPVVGIYRSSLLPDSRATTDLWRAEAARWGLPGLYLVRIESFRTETGDPRPLGFDASVLFQPSWQNLPRSPAVFRGLRRLSRFSSRLSHRVYRYCDLADEAMRLPAADYPRWPSVTPGFDNSSRRKVEATILLGSSPAKYERWLRHAVGQASAVVERFEPGQPSSLVFVNAWNEWAEGNHLEPDQRYGRGFLDATRRAVDASVAPSGPARVRARAD